MRAASSCGVGRQGRGCVTTVLPTECKQALLIVLAGRCYKLLDSEGQPHFLPGTARINRSSCLHWWLSSTALRASRRASLATASPADCRCTHSSPVLPHLWFVFHCLDHTSTARPGCTSIPPSSPKNPHCRCVAQVLK